MNASRSAGLTLLCLFLVGCGDFRLGFPTVSDAAPCEGNACADITIKAENPGYTIRNTGKKTVIVSIKFTFGLSCLDPTDITLGAGQSKTYGNGAYCNPYRAVYAGAGVPVPPRRRQIQSGLRVLQILLRR